MEVYKRCNAKLFVFSRQCAHCSLLFASRSLSLSDRSVCRERLPSSLSDQVDMVVYLDVEPKGAVCAAALHC